MKINEHKKQEKKKKISFLRTLKIRLQYTNIYMQSFIYFFFGGEIFFLH